MKFPLYWETKRFISMAKRFRLRICRVIATTLQSCRSKDSTNLTHNPVPSFSSVLRPKFSSAVAAAATSQPMQFNWQQEDKWHVVAKIHHPPPTPHLKIYNSDDEDDLTFAHPAPPPPLPPSSAEKNRRRAKKKKNVPTRLRLSTSSADSGWFSSEGGALGDEIDEEETETLVSSSISISPESSSELKSCSNLHPIRETQSFAAANPRRSKRRSVSKRTKRGVLRPPPSDPAAADGDTPARLSVFKKLIPCTVDGKVKESFAIVKRSEDPYEDFRISMMDMIVEKQMFEKEDLEQLLQCFLSLNSRHYHGIIVQAFSEIWEAIFLPAAESEPSAAVRHHRRVPGLAT